ncbi:MAG: helix-turn-helix domain-containing protein [Synergistaceae bacterium]|nr:helix-turn-helix domain-containing protein [Synergistaceae bacterium]
MIDGLLLSLNDDEVFYRSYFEAARKPETLRKFLRTVDVEDARRRKLIIPELLPENISYQMNDDEYFSPDDPRNVFISPHNRYTPAFTHRHMFFEIAYVYSGHCTQNIGTERVKFTAGDFIFVAPGIYHTMEVFDDTSIILNILIRKGTFHQMFLPLAKGKDIQSQFFREGLYDSHRIEYLAYHTGNSYRDFMSRIYGEHLTNDEYSDQIQIGMLITMTAEIMRSFQDSMTCSYSEGNIQNDEGFAVLGYIQEHNGTLNLSDVARHFGFSESRCSRLIQRTTGMSFNDWKRLLRVRRAENMLLNTGMTINEISLALGYENTETFIRLFRKVLHITPGKYREEMGTKNNLQHLAGGFV